jgi:PAS domain S-box-containing protein/putative nucleotidyltransferase with HDIG domain
LKPRIYSPRPRFKSKAVSPEWYRHTLDHMLEGCQVIGYDWRYIYVNEAAARHGRQTPDRLINRTMMEVYPGIENTEMFAVLKRCMQERAPQLMESKFENPDGSTGWFELSIQPVPEGLFILSIDVTGRKLAELQMQKQLARMNALRKIDLAVLSSFDLDLTLTVSLDQIVEQLGVDAVDVLLLDITSTTLSYAARRGFRFNAIERGKLPVGQGYASRVLLEQQVVHLPNLEVVEESKQMYLLEGEGFTSYIGAPLVVKGKIRGVLEIFNRTPLEVSQDWLDFLEVLTGQVAIALDNATLFKELQRSNSELMLAYEATLEGWSAALDLRDRETEGHTRRVTLMAMDLAEEMGIREWELVNLRRGALLHDIGKMGVPDYILLKPDKLTGEEWEHMQMHAVYAYNLLSNITYLRDALDIPYCHHEKWNGTGYPRGLKGEEIPFSARIFAVADVYDALTSDRPYRKGWSHERTLDYIRDHSGDYFDPNVVDVFLNMVGTEKQE